MKLVVASNNVKKRREIKVILDGLGLDLVPAEDTLFVDVAEDADSFAGNARKKAEAFARANQCPALADDSGLCVNALNGAPGIYSSRYAGESATDADNNIKLLHELKDIEDRGAYFACAIYLSFVDGRAPVTATGRVDGSILESPVGNSGFGYDPLFYCPELGKAFANASPEEKASVSHRGRALRELTHRLSGQHLG